MRSLVALVAAGLLTLAACSSAGDRSAGPSSPSASSPASTGASESTGRPSPSKSRPSAGKGGQAQGPVRPHVVRTVATGLAAPWGVTFLPDGTALVGERDSGRVLAVDGGQVREVGRLQDVAPQGEGGFLGLAASPSYDEDRLVFAYLTTAQDNRVVRMTYAGGRLGEERPVVTGIPHGFIHNGGRLLFAGDGTLFVSTGESGDSSLAQDRGSLGGKILHVTPDGEPAPGAPFPGSPVWTLGHRNVEGLAFDGRGRLWATEFGANAWDEVNLIRRGDNYGWPEVEGRNGDSGFTDPFVVWSTDEASPAGVAYAAGSLWVGALRGERLWQVPLTQDGTGEPRDWFVGDFGRLRTVVVAPNGNLWVTTSNRDGRGDPAPEDDRILEVALR